MQTTNLRTDHEDTNEGTHWAIWTGAAVGAAAVLGVAGYLTWRWTRTPSVTQRMRDRADKALGAIRR